MPNKSAGPLDDKKVIFATSNDISELKQYGGADRVVAVMPGTTKEQIDELRAAGYSDVVLWDPNPSQNTVDEVKNMGYDAVIVQNEGPEQGEGSKLVADNLAGSGVTTGMVTNNWMPSYDGYGNVSVVMPEVYGTNQTWDSSTGNTESRFPPGYNPTIMPVVGGDAPPPGYESYAAQQAAGAATHGGYGVFSGNQSPDVMNPILNPAVPTAPTPGQTTPTTQPAPTPNTTGANPNPTAPWSNASSNDKSGATHSSNNHSFGAMADDGETAISQTPRNTPDNTVVDGAQTVAPKDATPWSSAVYNDQHGTTGPGGNPKGFGAMADDGTSSSQVGASTTAPTSSYIHASAPTAPTPATSDSTLDPAIASVVNKKKQQSGGGDSSDTGGGITTGGSSPDSSPDPGVSVLTADPSATGSCFAAGTPVLTPEGEKPIEEVKEGDKVQSWDFSTCQLAASEVTKTMVHQNKSTIVLTTGLGDLVTTLEHRFWTGSGWTSAGKLEPNSSRILDKDGDLRLVKAVKDGQTEDVYHFHVADPHHNYFAGHLLGHNMKQLE